MKREFITISGLKKILSPKEMKNVLGGSGGENCCLYECGGDPWFIGIGYMTQDECWAYMVDNCMYSFTIQPCPW